MKNKSQERILLFQEIIWSIKYLLSKIFLLEIATKLKYVLPESLEPSGMMQILSTDYKFAVSFTILIIVLLVRPSGIFKGRVI